MNQEIDDSQVMHQNKNRPGLQWVHVSVQYRGKSEEKPMHEVTL